MAHGEVKHDYHLVNPSPWPLVGSMGAFIMAVGAVMLFHGGKVTFSLVDGQGGLTLAWGPWALITGLVIVLFTMFGWWSDVVREAEVNNDHTPIVQLGLRYGMILFIASEVMFFVAWFWAYFDAHLFVDQANLVGRIEATGGVWPPKGIETFNPWDIPFLNTLVLLLSGTTVTWAHHALLNGNRRGLVQGLGLTIILGLIFTGLQAYEYHHAFSEDLTLKSGIYGSTFFMATGFHGFHVIVGTIFLIVCFFRSLKGHFKPDQHFGFEAAAWYWHFVDVVWLFLFSAIYVWGAGSAGH